MWKTVEDISADMLYAVSIQVEVLESAQAVEHVRMEGLQVVIVEQ